MSLAPGSVFSPPLVAHVAADKWWQFTFLDEDGAALDVEGDTLTLIVEDRHGNNLASVAKSGGASSTSFRITAAQHATTGVYRYAVRNDSGDGQVLASNSYRILEAAA